MPLILRGRVAWAHDFVGNPALSAVFETLPGASFTVNGAPIPHDSALTSAGAELFLTPRWTLPCQIRRRVCPRLADLRRLRHIPLYQLAEVFRDAFKRSHCLIPMSGYYEWQNTPGGKQPWYFTDRDGSPLLTAAGLWDEWKNRETRERLKSCTMVVTEPNEFAAEIHDRMPVFLMKDQFAP